ncbi:AcrR family transcriptional regulator [Prauserella sediminis]|uniref:AcrR family transcriptional regulator n=1 Tax=Prauserella sediminis TaxID=577680 RepID=A0A839XML6_9PSEU|nr:TetR/AcrR family transcriptional regulator [Prauserella sediminis]MBB3663981.1 AcrR family transcriptional regulator [Prauserella sediminis]
MARTAPSGKGPRTGDKRPRDRKTQLAAVAAELFRARGYHGVGINDIAAAAGITGPALYRHFKDKQAILAHVLRAGLEEIEEATGAASLAGAHPSPDQLNTLLTELAGKSVERRDAAALWRWEGRHLDAETQRDLRERSGAMLATWTKVLLRVRPELPPEDAELLCWAVLSVFGSVSVHRTSVPKRRFEQLLVDIATRVLRAGLPTGSAPSGPDAPATGIPHAAASDAAASGAVPPGGVTSGAVASGATGTPDLAAGAVGAGPASEPLTTPSRREQILTEATELFASHGFSAVSMDDIGRAAGIAGPSVYRHFPSKASLLGAIGRRAGDRLLLGAEDALRSDGEWPALHRLAESYVATLTGQPELLVSFSVDRVHIDERDRPELLRIQREYVSRWVRLLEAARPELDTREAKITVHAALTVANDLTRTRRVNRRPNLPAELLTLMSTVLGAGGRDTAPARQSSTPDVAGQDGRSGYTGR